jgi:hypothetical protein
MVSLPYLQVFSRIWLSLSIRIHRYGVDSVEINVIIIVLDLRLATIVGSTIRIR